MSQRFRKQPIEIGESNFGRHGLCRARIWEEYADDDPEDIKIGPRTPSLRFSDPIDLLIAQEEFERFKGFDKAELDRVLNEERLAEWAAKDKAKRLAKQAANRLKRQKADQEREERRIAERNDNRNQVGLAPLPALITPFLVDILDAYAPPEWFAKKLIEAYLKLCLVRGHANDQRFPSAVLYDVKYRRMMGIDEGRPMMEAMLAGFQKKTADILASRSAKR